MQYLVLIMQSSQSLCYVARRKRRTRLTGVGCVDERRKDEGHGNDDAEPSCSSAVHGGCPTTSTAAFSNSARTIEIELK